MFDGKVLDLSYHLSASEQCHVFFGRGNRRLRLSHRYFRQGYVHAEAYHIFFEVYKFIVYAAVSFFFSLIHVVQLVQDDLERFVQSIEMYFFLAAGLPAAFNSEICVYQEEGFYGKILDFQIPGGMVGRNMAYHRHTESVEARACVIIMKIRDALFLALSAAVFADIVSCRSSRNQPQIYRYFKRFKLTRRMHGYIVNACDMSESIVRFDFNAKPHKFVEIISIGDSEQAKIFLVISFLHYLFRRKEAHFYGRVERQRLFFNGIQRFEQLKKEQSPLDCRHSFDALVFLLSGEKLFQYMTVAALKPAFLRLLAQFPKHRLRMRQNLFRYEASPFIGITTKFLAESFHIFFLKEILHLFTRHVHLFQKELFCHIAFDDFVKPYNFVHSFRS